MAAGARLTSSCLPSSPSALAVPRAAKSKGRRAESEEQRAKSRERRTKREEDRAVRAAMFTVANRENEKSQAQDQRLALSSWLFARALRSSHRHLPLQSDRFLIIRVDCHCARGVLPRFAEIAALEKYSTQKDVSID